MLIHPGRRVLTTRLNMTPMIDCVFLLLTFFMVVSELSRQYDAVEVALPRVTAGSELPPTARVIKVTAQGDIYYAGERVSLERLADILVLIRRDDPAAAVVIKADERTPFKHIRAIFKLCADRRVKVWRLAFGVRPLDEPDAPTPSSQEELR